MLKPPAALIALLSLNGLPSYSGCGPRRLTSPSMLIEPGDRIGGALEREADGGGVVIVLLEEAFDFTRRLRQGQARHADRLRDRVDDDFAGGRDRDGDRALVVLLDLEEELIAGLQFAARIRDGSRGFAKARGRGITPGG